MLNLFQYPTGPMYITQGRVLVREIPIRQPKDGMTTWFLYGLLNVAYLNRFSKRC